jgi:carbonic anhydrase/acetyltransferase-like protein (isoleucine patch superfamily)
VRLALPLNALRVKYSNLFTGCEPTYKLFSINFALSKRCNKLLSKIENMPLIKSVRGFTPKFGENCYLADNATIIGDVVIGRDCSIWFSTVLRGDVNSIRIGDGVYIQDGSVLHTLYQKSTIEIGDYVSIGHNVTIHGAKIEDYALIGMGATLLDHAVIGKGSIVAAGSLILSNMIIEPGSIWGGVPAKFIKKVDPEQAKELNRKIAHNYLMYSDWYK